ncbi:uncharacterized protein LOC119768853 isoform X1 [Culex quinquefasciatus]|uniref:uncharacterized protein LOC119768853 isoform X1 n=1 Tax=Culex quinquefasciatus TaxID=7176 RepID=UPI0018E2C182|nr:uncharacterized protein LOC119768853 isoform X1 [Culex quinquefasciatus]
MGLEVEGQFPRGLGRDYRGDGAATALHDNEFALKKINVWFLDKYEKVNFHGELTDPTKRRTTSGIIGGVQRRCCTRCRRFTTPQLSTYKRSPRDGRMKCSKSNSVPRISSTPCSGCASRIGISPFKHFTSQSGNIDHPSRINGQLLQDCPDEGRQRDHPVLYTAVAHRNVHPEPSSLGSSEVTSGVP